VLFGLAEGDTPSQIQSALNCDSMSLRNIEVNLMTKLGAKSKSHMISRAFVLGLLFSRTLCLLLAVALSGAGDDWVRIARTARTGHTRINRIHRCARTRDA